MELGAWGERQANRPAGSAPTASSIPLGLSSLQRHGPIHSGPLSPGGADGQPRALTRAASVQRKACLACVAQRLQLPEWERPTAAGTHSTFQQPGLSTTVCQALARLSGQAAPSGSLCLALRRPRRGLGAAETRARPHTQPPVAACLRAGGPILNMPNGCFTESLPCARRCAEHLTVVSSGSSHGPRRLALFSFPLGRRWTGGLGRSHTFDVTRLLSGRGEIWPQTHTVDLGKMMDTVSFQHIERSKDIDLEEETQGPLVKLSDPPKGCVVPRGARESSGEMLGGQISA